MGKNDTQTDAASEQPKTLTPPKQKGAVSEEEIITEKMRAGLTREQAIQVMAAQAENDKASKS